MQEGASIRITPSWVPTLTIVDISWDTDNLALLSVPQGPWWGEFALLAGFESQVGEWDCYKNEQILELWVPYPPDQIRRHLLATLNHFVLPARNGNSGMGVLASGIAPVNDFLEFNWEVAAIV